MRTTRDRFIIKHYDAFGGNFVDSQYLGAAYETGKPHVFEDTLTRIFSSRSRFFTGKPLLGMTSAKKMGKHVIDTEIYRWRLQGAEEKCARVVENLEIGNAAPGLNNTPIRVKLDLDYYQEPDVLMPEDPEFPLEVMEGAVQDGSGYIYTFMLQGDAPDVFLPSYLLEEGREFAKVWTTIQSEYNERYGTQQYPDSFMLESQVGAFAQKNTVTDKAWRDEGKIAVDFEYTDPRTNKRQKVSNFLPMMEAKMYDELYMGMEAQAWYGKKETRSGHKGYWKKTGPGVREQLKDSWIEYYNSALTVTRLRDFLMDIFFTRVDEQDRKVVAMTGTLGSIMFHDMLAAEASSFLTVDHNFTERLTSNPRHLSFGAQFTHYQGPEGIEVSLVKNPMYDSRKYCKRMHPQYTEFPIDSMRMTFLDFGQSRSTSMNSGNIMTLEVKDTFSWGYVHGTYTPTGPVKGGQAGALIDGYDIYCKGTHGICIKDVSRCGELIFDHEF